MAKKTTPKGDKTRSIKESRPGRNVLLTLTLVPLVIGVLLIGAWVLDMEILDDPQSQMTVGIFFLLVSFATSNALQQRWNLAAGWGILAIADIITLAWLNPVAQIVALSVGLTGVILLGGEFYIQYQKNKENKAKK